MDRIGPDRGIQDWSSDLKIIDPRFPVRSGLNLEYFDPNR